MLGRYHHGDLRAAVLAAAADVIARDGVDQLSLRSLAVELGVSHTAPRHHFGSREGVLTALACEGYKLLAEALEMRPQTATSPLVWHMCCSRSTIQGTSPSCIGRSWLTVPMATCNARSTARPPSSTLALALMVVDQPRRRGGIHRGMVAGARYGHLATQRALDAAGLPQQAGGDLRSIALRAVHQLFSGVSPNEPTTRRRTDMVLTPATRSPLAPYSLPSSQSPTAAPSCPCSCRDSADQRPAESVLSSRARPRRRACDLGSVIKILTSTEGVPALAQQLSDGVLYAAILMPAGFFLSVTGRDPQKPNRLFVFLWIGAASLTVGLVSAGVGLIMAGTR